MSEENLSSNSIMDSVKAFFQQDDWTYEEIAERNIIRMRFSGENANWTCYAQVKEEQERLMFYSTLETKVPEDKRQVMAEFLTRANFGLLIGNFEMDFSDGEIRFKTSVDIEDINLTYKFIQNLVYMNVLMMDKYLPGIMSVIYGNMEPLQAIALVET
jgi:hypothetical protein